jgi:hypothetical protein
VSCYCAANALLGLASDHGLLNYELTSADLLYLFCTCTAAFCRFLPIEPIELSKSFENSTIVADRLPPPPNHYLFVGQIFTRPIDLSCT